MADVERSQRFVPELKGGFGCEGPAQEDPHALTAGQPVDRSIGEFDQVATLDEGIDAVVVISVRVTSLRNNGSRGKAEREFNVRLVLVQAMKHDRKVSGDVSLIVEGVQDGVETSYDLTQLIADAADRAWPYSFRYFQDFDRQLVLPDGFTPERIKVEVRSRTRSISSIEESFAWVTSQS